MDDFFNSFNSRGNKGNYTLEEIEKAEKLKKKNGGTLMENLVKLTGRNLPLTGGISGSFSSNGIPEAKFSEKKDHRTPEEQLLRNQENLNRELQNLQQSHRFQQLIVFHHYCNILPIIDMHQ